jgi:transposase
VLAVRGAESKTAVAARLHVSRESIHTWLERADPQTGEVDLHDPGPQSRMDASMRERLAALIEREFAIRFSEQRVSTLMREMGYSPQKPERSAKERKPDRIMEWKQRVLPAVGGKSG